MEGHRILQPGTVLFTNALPDHVEAMGWTEEEVCGTLLASVPPGARVLLSPSASPQVIERARSVAGEGVQVADPGDLPTAIPPIQRDNAALAASAARGLGADEESIRRGLGRFREDAGGLRAWRLAEPAAGRPLFAVSAFSANDPLSTREVLAHVLDRLPAPSTCHGILSLRGDRADRTLQWIRALRETGLAGVDTIFATGPHARIAASRVPGVRVLAASDPREATRRACRDVGGDGPHILFGFGNFKGLGEELAAWWAAEGSPVEL